MVRVSPDRCSKRGSHNRSSGISFQPPSNLNLYYGSAIIIAAGKCPAAADGSLPVHACYFEQASNTPTLWSWFVSPAPSVPCMRRHVTPTLEPGFASL